jgi:Recombinase zinc beta ribbon domain/Resolvase, N terminal domain
MLVQERSGSKIQGRHRDRLAVVYVRQSSRQQVADHQESTRLQYGLAERAVALGWAPGLVRVIDEDLGRSAAAAEDRPGFQRLVTEVTMGQVGLGPALLAGLVVCGICGRRMGVTYETNRAGLIHRYSCVREHQSYGTQRCQQMAGAFLDAWVTGQVLAALAPAALELSVHAAGQAEQRRAEVDRIWRQRLERADQACDRARRQYQLAEPENRLVTRQLEKDWEAALAARQQLAEDYQRFTRSRPARLTAAERAAAIERLARDIPALWQAPATTHADRKRLLRCVIEQVQVAVPGASEKVHAAIMWAGGSTTTADLVRPVAVTDSSSAAGASADRTWATTCSSRNRAAICWQRGSP